MRGCLRAHRRRVCAQDCSMGFPVRKVHTLCSLTHWCLERS
ncbi:rCG34476 [Rattus norvegicus]|uniref:RCG34476 n=1 Tax=Rattus norvegicus TaxID=10116 RepID=A6HKI0_RAT|nr:rCG34476 [Rattus norvegicus]